jgi:peptidoglycan-associated lipoprotein
MSSRHRIQLTIVLLSMCVLLAGCTRPIVKPGGPSAVLHPGGIAPGMQPSGPIGEQEMQAIQATLRPVYFNYDQYTLSPEAQEALRYNAEILKRTPNLPIVAEGHCDERGTSEYNLALGDRRARSSVEFLAGLGVPAERLSSVSYGSELPVDPGHNEAAWSKNRRVYLRVSNK